MGCRVEAICPNCGKEYIALLPWEWKGRGILKRYCPTCRRGDFQRGVKEMPLRGAQLPK